VTAAGTEIEGTTAEGDCILPVRGAMMADGTMIFLDETWRLKFFEKR